MPNFIGFNTIDKDKKFTMIDRDLIKRDLLNSFLLRAGTLPGRPEVGTQVWDYIFDPNDTTTRSAIDLEVRRIVGLDPRIVLNALEVVPTDNIVVVQLSVSLLPDYSTEEFYIKFIQDSQTATIT